MVIWDPMQVVDIYDQGYLRLNASCGYIWSNLFSIRCKLLISMIKLILHRLQVADIYDQAYLRLNGSSWYM